MYQAGVMKSEMLKAFNKVQGVNVTDFNITSSGAIKMEMSYTKDVENPGLSAVKLAKLIVDMRDIYPDYIRTEAIKAMEVSTLPS